MTPKFSKRILNKKKRSIRKYAVGGRPIKANWDKGIEEVLTFSSTNHPNKKLYVTKTYSSFGSSLYSIYSYPSKLFTFVFKKYCKTSFGGIGTCKIPKDKLNVALKELFKIIGASNDIKTENIDKDVDFEAFTKIANNIIKEEHLKFSTNDDSKQPLLANSSTDDFIKKLNTIIDEYYPNDKFECLNSGDNLLFNEIRDSSFTKVNAILCGKSVEPTVTRDAAYKLNKHTNIQHILSKSVLSILNLKYKEPTKKDNLMRECNESLKKATEKLITKAKAETVGLLAKVGTVGTSVVSGFMVAAGVSASTGIGLPVAAGLIALALISNELMKLANKNQEFKDLMYLIWCMCYRFENLINLMNVMASRLEFDINKALMPVKEVMSRLIAQISALAPKSALINMKSQYMRDDGIEPPKEGDYNMTDSTFPKAPEGYVYAIDTRSTKEPNKLVYLNSSTGKVVDDPKPSQIDPPKGYRNYVDPNTGDVKWRNIKDPENIISASVYNKRIAENDDDKHNLLGKMGKSISRKLDRISSPDENYNILMRDITILSSWFSIIFSEFMLVVGSRNDVIKDIIKTRHSGNKKEIDENSIEFIREQLDFMNDICKNDAYKRLIRDSLIVEGNKTRIIDTFNEEKEKLKNLMTDDAKQKICNIMEDIQNGTTKEQNKAFEKLITNQDFIDQIQESAGKIITSYKTLKNGDGIAGLKESISLLEQIETENGYLNHNDDKCNNDKTCQLEKIPFIINNKIMSVVYDDLMSFVSNVPELFIKYQCKSKKYKKSTSTLLEIDDASLDMDSIVCDEDKPSITPSILPVSPTTIPPSIIPPSPSPPPPQTTILHIHNVSFTKPSNDKIYIKIKWNKVAGKDEYTNEYKTHEIPAAKYTFNPSHEVNLGVINNTSPIPIHFAIKKDAMVVPKTLAEEDKEPKSYDVLNANEYTHILTFKHDADNQVTITFSFKQKPINYTK